jgi:hypothetical protein
MDSSRRPGLRRPPIGSSIPDFRLAAQGRRHTTLVRKAWDEILVSLSVRAAPRSAVASARTAAGLVTLGQQGQCRGSDAELRSVPIRLTHASGLRPSSASTPA